MRIIGGRFRGKQLAAPGKAGGGAAHLRPTADRVREALFNLLAHGDYGDPPPPEGRRVLDLFAGTGALGLEALSRGAVRVQFVDDHGPSRALIRRNIEALDVIGEPYDLVFLDPPYGTDLGARALASAAEGGWLAPGALVVTESAADQKKAPEPEGFERLDERIYGETRITILRAE